MGDDTSPVTKGAHHDLPRSAQYQRLMTNIELVQSTLDPETRDQLKRTEWVFHRLLAAEPRRRASREEPVEPIESDGDPVRVLVVEDDPDLVELYERWLAGEYDLSTATSGGAAFDYLDDDIDIVLLDRNLPDRSGDAILADIRDRDLPCRVAMVTAVEPDFDIIELGVDEYVTKPVSKSALLEVVERLSKRANYDEEVREYFALASTKAALDAKKDSAERSANKEYARLEHDLEARRNRIDAMFDEMEDNDFDVLLRTFPATEVPVDCYEPPLQRG